MADSIESLADCSDPLPGTASTVGGVRPFAYDFAQGNLHDPPISANEQFGSELVFHFHPILQQIIYSDDHGTYLWNFRSLLHSTIHDIHQEHVQIYSVPLRNIRIADSGNLLFSFESVGEAEKVAVISLVEFQKKVLG